MSETSSQTETAQTTPSKKQSMPVYVWRGAAVFALGTIGTFLLMANDGQVFRGALYGCLTTVVAAIGMLDLLGLFSPRSYSAEAWERATSWNDTALGALPGEPLAFSPRVLVPVAIFVFTAGALVFGIPGMPATILATLLVLGALAYRRPAMLVFVIASAIILPCLGTYGLWDPWETHYGEVAREILARDDWISLWWAQEDWFWSKPIFIFWSEALSMSAFGVGFAPDANPIAPEWAIRFPHYVLSLSALLAVYACVQRAFGKRAGVLAALVLATMPHYFMLSHQAITDMPFVSTMTIAMAMFGLALCETPDREVKLYRFGKAVVSAQHALIFGLVLVSLPQILLLITRNITWVSGGFHPHLDEFVFGSAGNAGNPGNAELRAEHPAFSGIGAQPATEGLIWLLGLVILLVLLRRERRAQSLAMYGFYLFCALSFMAKGIPGFALPGMVAMFFLIAARRWDLLLEGRLRVGPGIAMIATVGLPWYVAMYIRHGQGFTDRLLVHDHINRLTAGVHGDTGSIEYFLEQLGTGLFPWVALMPLAIGVWVTPWSRGARAEGAAESGDLESPMPRILDPQEYARSEQVRRELLLMFGLWGTSAFVLFSAMTTKFHHYIFPAVPACGVLVGIAFDRLFGRPSDLTSPNARGTLGVVLSALAPLPIVLGVAGFWGDVRGVVPARVTGDAMRSWVIGHPWYLRDCLLWIALGVGLLVAAHVLLRPREESGGRTSWLPATSSALFAAPVILGLVGRDLSWVTSSRPAGYERLIHLFVYNYGRPWPEQFDYRPVLTAFAICMSITIGLAALPFLRRMALCSFLGLSFGFAAWCLDVYLIDLSPHWGQRELFEAYYRERSGPEEPVLAWQMNWKGENFYTGNRVLAFADLDNRKLQDWVREHAGQTAFVVLEHTRLSSLRGVLRGAEITEVTDMRIDNKFILIKARLPLAAPRVPPRPAE